MKDRRKYEKGRELRAEPASRHHQEMMMNTPMTRRAAVTTMAALGVAATGGAHAWARERVPGGAVEPEPDRPGGAADQLALPALAYPSDALEPFIDAETMRIHHDRHHRAYVDNANKLLAGTPWAALSPEHIVAHLADIPEAQRVGIRNNVGGHLNHTLFWTVMAPPDKGGGGEPTGVLADAIRTAFGSFDGPGGFKERFAAAAAGRFGSGWAWLVVRDGRLEIGSTCNQDHPLMGEKVCCCAGVPVLGLDVWEHAYYLKYRNKRADYIGGWWNVVNWTSVAAKYDAAQR